MKCPKCGYNSFDHLNSCKKCNTDLTEHKAKFNLHGFYSTGLGAGPAPVSNSSAQEVEPESDGSVDFGFDFLEEDEEGPSKGAQLENDQDVSISQPFGADSESIPADELDDDDDKPGKGPEFAF